jgi:hypothetical protein
MLGKCIGLMLLSTASAGAAAQPPSATAPASVAAGAHLVADDDCGNPSHQPHVLRGQNYHFGEQVQGTEAERTIIFDADRCILAYAKLNPAASYWVEVVYASDAARRQRLVAGGQVIHADLDLPTRTARRHVFAIPAVALAKGQLELEFVRVTGANAVVSLVRIWSSDSAQLGAPPAALAGRADHPARRAPANAPGPVLPPNGSRPIKQVIQADWDSQDGQADLRKAAARHLQRGRAILKDLRELGAVDLDPLAAEIDSLTAIVEKAPASVSADDVRELYHGVRWAVRRLALRNPLLGSEILFVRRHHPDYNHQCARRLAAATRSGGAICILRGLAADGDPQVVDLTSHLFVPGVFSRPDISFDGRRIVFGYGARRADGGGFSESAALADKGINDDFQVWEMGIDGKTPAPQRLTRPEDGRYSDTDSGRTIENSDPIYLPDGRIAFMSHRTGGLVQCGDWALAYCMYSIKPDGSDLRKLTWAKEGEWDPALMLDGTIMFTRWEYMMRFWSPTQMIWTIRPDGTNPRIIYGADLTRLREYPNEICFASSRQVPGTDGKLITIGAQHHNNGSGPLWLIDLKHGREVIEARRDIGPVKSGAYDHPFPLSDSYFLVSFCPSASGRRTTDWGLYLVDAYGGQELLYRDPELSALFGMPLRARPTPPRMPDARPGEGGGLGEFFVQNVHMHLPPQMQGKGRYLRIVEAHERHIHTRPYNIEVGPDSGFEVKTVLGTVPVESDGSAYFRVPAGKAVFFSVLDGQYRSLHTMRMTTDVKPGERVSCVGCHEPLERAPAGTSQPLALRRPASDPTPPPWGIARMGFAKVIQPILDKHCIRCHDGKMEVEAGALTAAPPPHGKAQPGEAPAPGKARLFALTATNPRPFMTVPIPESYYALRRFVRNAPIRTYYTTPGSWGSGASPLMDRLAAGHQHVKLSPVEWQALCAWIDCNAPYLDDYRAVAAEPRLRDEYASGVPAPGEGTNRAEYRPRRE